MLDRWGLSVPWEQKETPEPWGRREQKAILEQSGRKARWGQKGMSVPRGWSDLPEPKGTPERWELLARKGRLVPLELLGRLDPKEMPERSGRKDLWDQKVMSAHRGWPDLPDRRGQPVLSEPKATQGPLVRKVLWGLSVPKELVALSGLKDCREPRVTREIKVILAPQARQHSVG